MATRAAISMKDYDKEKADTLLWVLDITAGNFGTVTQDIDEIKDAIDTISIGVIQEASFSKTFPEAGGLPSDPNAQRETKWLVTYQDVLQFLDVANTIVNAGYLKVFTAEIPCADLSLLAANTSELDITTPASVGALFKAAFEANVRSPYNHSSPHAGPYISVLSVKHVGRNT